MCRVWKMSMLPYAGSTPYGLARYVARNGIPAGKWIMEKSLGMSNAANGGNVFKRIKRELGGDSKSSIGGNFQASTYQRDVQSVYRKKRLSRRKLRRVIKKSRRFVGMQLKNVASCQLMRTSIGTVSGSAGQQGVGVVAGLYGLYGTAGTFDDCLQLRGQVAQTYPALASSTGSIDPLLTQAFYCKNARYEIDVTNTGSTPCVVELYLCQARKGQTFKASPSNDVGVSNYALNGATVLATTDQYASPFQFDQFTKNWKILNAKKLYLPAAGAADCGITDKRRIKISPYEFNVNSANTVCDSGEGRCMFWLMIVSGSVEQNAGSPRFSASQVSYVVMRKYNVKALNTSKSVSVRQ